MRLRPSHLIMAAIAILILCLAGITYVYWHLIMLAFFGVFAWRLALRRLLGSSPRGKRGHAVSALRKWADTAALALIAWRVGPSKQAKVETRPQPVYRARSRQIAADDPRWESDPHWPFRGPRS